MLNRHANMWLLEAMKRETDYHPSHQSFKRKENWQTGSRHLFPLPALVFSCQEPQLSPTLTQQDQPLGAGVIVLVLILSKDERSGRRASFLSLQRSDLFDILSGISECIFLKYILFYIRIRFHNNMGPGLGLWLTYYINILFVLFTWQTTSSVLSSCLEMKFWKNICHTR